MSRCPATTRWPSLAYLLGPAYGRARTAAASLTWRNSGSRVVAAEHQHDPAAGAHAADADHLARRCPRSRTAPSRCRRSVRAMRRYRAAGRELGDAGGSSPRPRDEVGDSGTISGGSATIRGLPSTSWVSLPNARMLSGSAPWPRLGPASSAARPLSWDLSCSLQLVGVGARVEDVQVALVGEAAHRLPVPAHGGQHHLPALLGGEPVLAPGYLQARGEPFDVPLPRAGQGLVEVVDVEDQAPLRRAEDAEVRQVRVTAGLHRQARYRREAARSAAIGSAAPR